jgi:hypothetical protein
LDRMKKVGEDLLDIDKESGGLLSRVVWQEQTSQYWQSVSGKYWREEEKIND